MKKNQYQRLSSFIVCLASLVFSGTIFAHEGLHAAGQVNVGSQHLGLFEISLSVIAFIFCVTAAYGKWKNSDK